MKLRKVLKMIKDGRIWPTSRTKPTREMIPFKKEALKIKNMITKPSEKVNSILTDALTFPQRCPKPSQYQLSTTKPTATIPQSPKH